MHFLGQAGVVSAFQKLQRDGWRWCDVRFKGQAGGPPRSGCRAVDGRAAHARCVRRRRRPISVPMTVRRDLLPRYRASAAPLQPARGSRPKPRARRPAERLRIAPRSMAHWQRHHREYLSYNSAYVPRLFAHENRSYLSRQRWFQYYVNN